MRFVASWHAIGFDECELCGATGPVRSTAPAVSAVDRFVEAVVAALPPDRAWLTLVDVDELNAERAQVGLPPSALPRASGASRARAPRARATQPKGEGTLHTPEPAARAEADWTPATKIGAGGSSSPATGRGGARPGAGRPAGSKDSPHVKRPPHPARVANAARDAEIVRRVAAGEQAKDVAAAFGLVPSRVSQIITAAKAAAALGGATP